MDTINKLLKKQAPKRRGKISATETAAGGDVTPHSQDAAIEIEKPNAIYVRWVSNRQGSRVGVPEEWLDKPVGSVFGAGGAGMNMGRRRMVEEVEG